MPGWPCRGPTVSSGGADSELPDLRATLPRVRIEVLVRRACRGRIRCRGCRIRCRRLSCGWWRRVRSADSRSHRNGHYSEDDDEDKCQEYPRLPSSRVWLVPSIVASVRQRINPGDGFPPHSRDKAITNTLRAGDDGSPDPRQARAGHPFDALAAAVPDRSALPSFTVVLAAQRSTML